jgi:hypothetical protein
MPARSDTDGVTHRASIGTPAAQMPEVRTYLATPFDTVVLGATVTVKKIDVTAAGGLIAICYFGRARQAIPILELPLPDPLPAGWEWIEAYRRWARGRW